MKITDQLFGAFLLCKTKCYLRSRGEVGSQSEYQQWQAVERQSYTESAVARLAEINGMVIEERSRFSDAVDLSPAKRTIVTEVAMATELLETTVQAIDLRPQKPPAALPLVAALRFYNTSKLTRHDRLMAAFDGLVLSERFGRRYIETSIVHGNGFERTGASSPAMQAEARKLIKEVSAVLSAASPPELVLNRHCAECEFRSRCQKEGIAKDDLSLLPGMTDKERKKLHAKGIFSATQLSYTFRPRRLSKQGRGRPARYHHSLKALSLRLGKIHMVGDISLEPV